MKIAFWNVNGLQCYVKKQTVTDILENQDLSIIGMVETHIREGNHEDLSMFQGYRTITVERGYGEKAGGGILLLVKDGIRHSAWNPVYPETPGTEKEKAWVLLHSGDIKIAIGFVYMAAQVPGNEGYRTWNSNMYLSLQKDLEKLKVDGYEAYIFGDFNGHVGCGEDGITGNLPNVNFNGRLLQDFVAINRMKMVNADLNLTTGLFTRTAGGYSTVLDYVLSTGGISSRICSLKIDEEGDIFTGSDHAGLILEIEAVEAEPDEEEDDGDEIRIPKSTIFTEFKTCLDELLNQQSDYGELSLNDKCLRLQEVIRKAGLKIFGKPRQRKKKRKNVKISKSLRKLKDRQKWLEKSTKRLSISKAARRLAGAIWTVDEQQRLNDKLTQLHDVSDKCRAQSLDDKMKRRNELRMKTLLKSKQFWTLVKKVMKQMSSLSAVEDADGQLVTNRKMIEDVVLLELGKIYRGQKSRIFDFKGEQLVKAAYAVHHEDHGEWIRKDHESSKFESEVCAPVSERFIQNLVNSHKDKRAPGVDEIPTRLYKNASELFNKRLTELVNECLLSGETPECLNTGKMTLIDKKESSLKISNKRPITVSSLILSVITKTLNHRMLKICERENMFGDTQYGFRPGRSSMDCIFLFLAAVRKAKKRKYRISVAFCDLQKAYDSLDREILYKKLDCSGFGGKVLQMVQSMYYNDNVVIKLSQGLSAPLWFTRGVKQGCALSPLLFALYIAGLGIRLQESKLGIEIGGVHLTGLFFADDLILVSKTPIRGMCYLLGKLNQFCTSMKMVLSVSKSFVLTTGDHGKKWRIGNSDDTLEESLVAKYLGVNIQLRGRCILNREKDVVSSARRYAHSIMSLTRAGLDRSRVARILWETCGIPAILYCSEVMSYSKRTTEALEKIQAEIGNFILQVPRSTSKVSTWTDAGLMPMKYRIWLRKARYYWRAVNKKQDPILTECIKEVMENHEEDEWAKDIKEIEEAIEANIPDLSLKQLREKVNDVAIREVLDVKSQHISLQSQPQPQEWFKLQDHINDSRRSKILNMARSGNLQLGNRMKNKYGKQWKVCPVCSVTGPDTRLNETHVILECPATNEERKKAGLDNYIQQYPGMTKKYILRRYLGQDGCGRLRLLNRARDIHTIVERWLIRTQHL